MNTTVDALKALYIAFGGSADDVANLTVIPDVILAIANLGSVKATSAMSVNSDGDVSITSANGIIINAQEAFNISGASDSSITTSDGADIEINADGIMYVKSGNSDVEINAPHGVIEINAPTDGVNITADSDININASGAAKLMGNGGIVECDDNVAVKAGTGSTVGLIGTHVTANGHEVATTS